MADGVEKDARKEHPVKIDRVLIKHWIDYGYFIWGPDNAPLWSERSMRKISGPARTLLYYLPYGGKTEFNKQCRLAGYNPAKLLHEHHLCSDDDAYGVPYDAIED